MSESLADLLAGAGIKLAHIDHTDYLAVRAVYAWPSNGAPTLYCLESEWPTMPAAKMAELLRVNDELVARVAELEARLAERPPAETPARNQAKMFAQQALALQAGKTEAPPDSIVCSDCGKSGWKNTHALDVHRGRMHAPIQFVEELGWHCAAKGCSGAHARDLHDAAFCTLHAERQHTNGALP